MQYFLPSQWFGGAKFSGIGSCRCKMFGHTYDKNDIACYKDFTYYMTFSSLVLIPILATICLLYIYKKKSSKKGTNVASKGTVAYEMSTNNHFVQPTTAPVPSVLSETHDGLRMQKAFCNIL